MPELTHPYARGLMTTHEALDDGWSSAGLSRAVRAGRLLRLTSGVYVDKETWVALSAEGRHLAGATARLLTRGPAWALARRSAALAHGLDLLGKPPTAPQLLRPWTGTERASSRHERVATLPPEQVIELAGLRVTSAARTVVDLSRAESFRSAVVTADSALRRGTTPDELFDVLRLCRRWPGGGAAARVLAFADGRAETALESISRVALRQLRLPVFEPQVEVYSGDRLVARVDGLWRDWLLVAEADGVAKYGDRADVYEEKRRQDELEDLGLTVVRWGWDDAWRPKGVVDLKVRRALARAQGRRLDPSAWFRSTTLEEAWERQRWNARAA